MKPYKSAMNTFQSSKDFKETIKKASYQESKKRQERYTSSHFIRDAVIEKLNKQKVYREDKALDSCEPNAKNEGE